MLALSIDKKREFRIFWRILVKTVWAVGLVAILASCGTSPGYNYTISGTVSGMIGSGLVLQDNGGDDQTISVNGAFAFATALTSGTAYSVTIKTHPTNPSQTCVVSNGSGTISGSPVYDVAVSCVMSSSPVTVDPSGLFAYVSNSSPGNISAYDINQTTGALVSVPVSAGNPFPAGTSPTSVTIYANPSGEFAYVPNMGSDTISAYDINQTTGALVSVPVSAGNPFPAGTSPTSVTIYANPSGGAYAYVPNIGSDTISAYIINSDGSLTAVTGSPFTAGTSPTSVTVYANSSGAYAYVPNMTDGTISAYTIDNTTTPGALIPSFNTPTVTAGAYPTSVTIYANPSGGAYAYVPNMGSGNISVYTINSDGSLSTGTAVTAGTYPMSVTVYTNPSGGAYAYVSNMGSGNISVYTINSDGSLSTGTAVTAEMYSNPVTVYANTSGAFAYVSNRNDGTIWVYSIGTNGALTNIQQISSGISFASLTTVTIDPQGPYAYASDVNTGAVYAFTIDSTTGKLNAVTGSPF
ncbi:MAG: beta-propeller fold lactonase family protein [Smithella sp.]